MLPTHSTLSMPPLPAVLLANTLPPVTSRLAMVIALMQPPLLEAAFPARVLPSPILSVPYTSLIFANPPDPPVAWLPYTVLFPTTSSVLRSLRRKAPPSYPVLLTIWAPRTVMRSTSCDTNSTPPPYVPPAAFPAIMVPPLNSSTPSVLG